MFAKLWLKWKYACPQKFLEVKIQVTMRTNNFSTLNSSFKLDNTYNNFQQIHQSISFMISLTFNSYNF